jgi:hypothetical protein
MMHRKPKRKGVMEFAYSRVLVLALCPMAAPANSPITDTGLPSRFDLSSKELAIYLDLYKAHYDLFVKAFAVYLAFVGTITGIVFQHPNRPGEMRMALSAFVAMDSILAIIASWISLKWIHETQGHLERICGDLGIPTISLKVTAHVVRIVLVLAFILTLAGFAGIRWFYMHD